MNTTRWARASAVASGALMLATIPLAMAFAEEEVTTDGVEVNVDIVDVQYLSMTVEGDSATLVEDGSDATARVFKGTLPTVTVTDTRLPENVPDGVYWYVLGSASDFTSDDGTITADNLGWAPRLIDGGESGYVAEGDPVDPQMDAGPGLVDQELLAMAMDSATVNPEGSWSATADLELKVPVNVAPGEYSSTMTLSLFE